MPLAPGNFYEFGPYRIDTNERRLLRGSEPLPLTPKAYETLLALVENAGRGLEKDELLHRIWPDTFVEEGSLTRNISVLRKVLEDEDGRYIETLPKRGYRFAAQVKQVSLPSESLLVDERTLSRVVIEETEATTWSLPKLRTATAGIVLVLIVAGALYFTSRTAAPPTLKSLAVLPLKSLAGGVDERHLELGIADSIIRKVSEIPDLAVRPTGAVRKYAESGSDPLQAARELRVDAVLDGTLQVAGDRIRVSLNLLQASSGSSLWTHVFDVPWSDIFEVEDEVARQVAAQLRLRLDSAGRAHLATRQTSNPEAYEHYLKGLYSNETRHLTGGTRASIEAAIVRFRKATDLDPSYGQAWAQLAICYSDLMNFYEPDRNLAAEARQAANRAYALAPDLPDLAVFRAKAFWSWNGQYQMEEALRELRRAARHNSSAVHSFLGAIYSHAGLDRQAIGELKRAIEIEPSNALHLDRLAAAYVWAGRYDDARAAYDRAFALQPETQGSLAVSALPFLYARQFKEARRRIESARAADPRNVVPPSYLALLAALEGRFEDAGTMIPTPAEDAERLLDAHHAFYAFASIFALQGKSPPAVRWLRTTVETGMPNYPMFARDPNLSHIRESAEFKQFMSELKPRWEAMEREFR